MPKVETCSDDELKCDAPLLETVVTLTFASLLVALSSIMLFGMVDAFVGVIPYYPDGTVVPQISVSQPSVQSGRNLPGQINWFKKSISLIN